MAPFLRENPNLRLNLVVAQNEYSNLLSEADVALTWGRPRRSTAVTKKLASATFSIYGVQEYFDQYGKPKNRENLLNHRLIQCIPYELTEGLRNWNQIIKECGPALTITNTTASMPIVVSSEFLGPFPDYVRQIEPRMIPLDIDLDVSIDLWISYDEQVRTSRRVRAVVDEIVRLAESQKGTWFL